MLGWIGSIDGDARRYLRPVWGMMGVVWIALAINWLSSDEIAHGVATLFLGVACLAVSERMMPRCE